MEKLNFKIRINAPREQVWKILWDDATYRAWTSTFMEGSHVESDWQEGSKILFLGPDGSGMTSRIAKLTPNEFMSFEHLGEVAKGVEDFTKDWAGALENYTLHPTDDGGTELEVELDISKDYADYFNKTFPLALSKVKELAEA